MGVDTEQRLAAVEHLALGGELQAGDDAQQGALAAARWPQQRHELARTERQVDLLDGREAPLSFAVGLADLAQLQQLAILVCS